MEWPQLISEQRLARPGPNTNPPGRSLFQQDFDRIVYSSAFRRLQDKTQVHLLPASDYVRTRLTHSLEVSCVGRSLGTKIGERVMLSAASAGLKKRKITEADFGDIVSAAALAHDIGNPPFGHSGEKAIQDWYKRDDVERAILHGLTERQRLDFQKFDGNAQGFRVLTNTQMRRGQGGLCLTHATLGTYMKYPCASNMTRVASHDDAGSKKPGLFESEQHYFSDIAETCGLIQRRHGSPAWARHPLVYLVEAADDLCYNVIDLEDGYKLGLVPFKKVLKLLQPISELTTEKLGQVDDIGEKVTYLRGAAIGRLVDQVAKVFFENEEALLSGVFAGDLISKTPSSGAINCISEYVRKEVYASKQNLETEIAGFDVLSGLLEAFTFSLLHPADSALARDVTPSKGEKIRKIFPQKVNPENRLETLHLITDHVAGMTDTYAISLYKKMKGISL